jgi:histidinol phosphatase-like enzyme (inositol monophosphatase family)
VSAAATFVALAQRLADAARAEILPRFRTGLAVDDKADSSPVTDADRGAERAMRALLDREAPDHGVIGEEYGSLRPDAEWVWVLDPVDGTKSFLVGRPTFCTLIGLLHRGRPVLGVIDQAVLGERWVGVDGGTTLNGRPVHTSPVRDLAAARLASTGPQYLPGDDGERFARLAGRCRFTVWGGDAYQYALLSLGGPDLVVESGLKLHDIAALAPVVTGAGGVMTDWEGRPITQDSGARVIAAATPQLHAEALAVLMA